MAPLSYDRAADQGRPVRDRTTPKLLISVRDRNEIANAVAGGADIIDLKEPRRGPLAPANADLWAHAAALWQQSPDSCPRGWLSAALGEQTDAFRVSERLPPEFAFAKVGPSRCDSPRKIRDLWAKVRQLLDDRIELVAVAYADCRNARCIDPDQIFRLAIEAGFKRCLIDTFDKDGRSTLDHLGIDGLLRLGTIARQGGLWWTLAGSIQSDCVSLLGQHGLVPDCFGVRGDVCQQGRTGTLSCDRVKLWKASLAAIGDLRPRVNATPRPRASGDI
jgi:uncharacterized protein (UPF0264 family)